METVSPSSQISTENTLAASENASKESTNIATDTLQMDVTKPSVIHHTKNLYPVVRHTVLVICVLLLAALIILLMHQNGKSIYDNGI